MEVRRFGEFCFGPSFVDATREDGGAVVRFTRMESLLLRALTARPGWVRTRDELLDAMTAPGSDAAGRNIDFLINRLRRKLGDDARQPRFIGTRYGEGYVWLSREKVTG